MYCSCIKFNIDLIFDGSMDLKRTKKVQSDSYTLKTFLEVTSTDDWFYFTTITLNIAQSNGKRLGQHGTLRNSRR